MIDNKCLILDRTPCDDYEWVMANAVEKFSYPESERFSKPVERAKLERKTLYQVFLTIMKASAVTAGISFLFVISLFVICYETENNKLTNILMFFWMLFFVSIILTFLLGIIGAPLEKRAHKRDIKSKEILDTETYLLKDGRIVTVSPIVRSGYQMDENKGLWMYDRISERMELSFSTMQIIHRVHHIEQMDGKIMIYSDSTELSLDFPSTNEDNVYTEFDDWFYYYESNFSGKITEWYDTIENKELLISALENLKS